jgi:hypothetical protein
MTLTSEQINQLIELYAEQCVEDMDIKCLIQFVYDTICENMKHAGEEEVLGQICDVYDEETLQGMIAKVSQ